MGNTLYGFKFFFWGVAVNVLDPLKRSSRNKKKDKQIILCKVFAQIGI